MAEISSNTWPENYVEVRPQVEQVQVVEKAQDVCLPVWISIIETCGRVNYLIDLSKIQSEKAQLKEEIEFNKPEFIEKLKQLPDYEGSKVKEAIEKGTIEIKKIPWRDGYAIYESKTWNLVYLTRLDGTRYTNVDYFRTRPWYEDWLVSWYIRKWYWKIELDKETWLWRLYQKDGKKVPIFSDEYATATLNAINVMWDIAEMVMNEAEKRRKKWEID